MIGCRTPEEVYENVKSWSSNLQDKKHTIRSTIIEIHAEIERIMKEILYWHFFKILFQDDEEDKNKKRRESLWNMVHSLNFSNVYRILKPCLKAYPASDLDNIPNINEIRNKVVHSNINNALYKNRNPFTNFDCLAQIYVESWAVTKSLYDFRDRLVIKP